MKKIQSRVMHVVMVIRKKSDPKDISYAKSGNTFVRGVDGIKVIGDKCSTEYDYKTYEFEDVDFWLLVEGDKEQEIYIGTGARYSWLEYFGVISAGYKYCKFFRGNDMLERLLI